MWTNHQVQQEGNHWTNNSPLPLFNSDREVDEFPSQNQKSAFSLSSLGGTPIESSLTKRRDSTSPPPTATGPLFPSSLSKEGGIDMMVSNGLPHIHRSTAQNIPINKARAQEKVNLYNSWNGNANIGTPKLGNHGMAHPEPIIDSVFGADHLDVFGADELPQQRKHSISSEHFQELDHPSRSRASSLPGNLAKMPHLQKNGSGQRASAWAQTDETGSPHSQKHKGYESATLYKTELCRSFTETGNCRYGIKCQFAHGADELRGVYRHPKYKTEICKTFHTLGTCNYGKRCRFIHLTPEEDERDRIGFGPNHERVSLPSSTGAVNSVWGANTVSSRKYSASSNNSNPLNVPHESSNPSGGRHANGSFFSSHSANAWPHNLSAPNEFFGTFSPSITQSSSSLKTNPTSERRPSVATEASGNTEEELPSSLGRLSFFQSLVKEGENAPNAETQ